MKNFIIATVNTLKSIIKINYNNYGKFKFEPFDEA